MGQFASTLRFPSAGSLSATNYIEIHNGTFSHLGEEIIQRGLDDFPTLLHYNEEAVHYFRLLLLFPRTHVQTQSGSDSRVFISDGSVFNTQTVNVQENTTASKVHLLLERR